MLADRERHRREKLAVLERSGDKSSRTSQPERPFLAAVLASLVIGCAATPYNGVLAVEVREVDNPHVACQEIEGRPLIARRSLGCSVWGRTPCLIVVGKIAADPKPRELETLGHELLHCMRGRWHS